MMPYPSLTSILLPQGGIPALSRQIAHQPLWTMSSPSAFPHEPTHTNTCWSVTLCFSQLPPPNGFVTRSPLPKPLGSPHHTPVGMVHLSGQLSLHSKDPGVKQGWESLSFQDTEHLQSRELKKSSRTLCSTSKNIVFAVAELLLLKNYFLNTSHALDILEGKKPCLILLKSVWWML